jgi:putative nucleotidyltransferase with HDIG domain
MIRLAGTFCPGIFPILPTMNIRYISQEFIPLLEELSRHAASPSRAYRVARFHSSSQRSRLIESLQPVSQQMVARFNRELPAGQVVDPTTITPSQAVELVARSPETAAHSMSVALLASSIASREYSTPAAIRSTVTAAIYHDIGKSLLPLEEVLEFRGRFTDAQREVLGIHSIGGALILNRAGAPYEVIEAAYHHHFLKKEYPTVSGVFPTKRSEIIKAADVFEAIRAKRAYKEPKSPQVTVQSLLERDIRYGEVDPRYVQQLFAGGWESAHEVNAKLFGAGWLGKVMYDPGVKALYKPAPGSSSGYIELPEHSWLLIPYETALRRKFELPGMNIMPWVRSVAMHGPAPEIPYSERVKMTTPVVDLPEVGHRTLMALFNNIEALQLSRNELMELAGFGVRKQQEGWWDPVTRQWRHVGTGELSEALKKIIRLHNLPFKPRSRYDRMANVLFAGRLYRMGPTDMASRLSRQWRVIQEGWFGRHVGVGERSPALRQIVRQFGLPYKSRSGFDILRAILLAHVSPEQVEEMIQMGTAIRLDPSVLPAEVWGRLVAQDVTLADSFLAQVMANEAAVQSVLSGSSNVLLPALYPFRLLTERRLVISHTLGAYSPQMREEIDRFGAFVESLVRGSIPIPSSSFEGAPSTLVGDIPGPILASSASQSLMRENQAILLMLTSDDPIFFHAYRDIYSYLEEKSLIRVPRPENLRRANIVYHPAYWLAVADEELAREAFGGSVSDILQILENNMGTLSAYDEVVVGLPTLNVPVNYYQGPEFIASAEQARNVGRYRNIYRAKVTEYLQGVSSYMAQLVVQTPSVIAARSLWKNRLLYAPTSLVSGIDPSNPPGAIAAIKSAVEWQMGSNREVGLHIGFESWPSTIRAILDATPSADLAQDIRTIIDVLRETRDLLNQSTSSKFATAADLLGSYGTHPLTTRFSERFGPAFARLLGIHPYNLTDALELARFMTISDIANVVANVAQSPYQWRATGALEVALKNAATLARLTYGTGNASLISDPDATPTVRFGRRGKLKSLLEVQSLGRSPINQILINVLNAFNPVIGGNILPDYIAIHADMRKKFFSEQAIAEQMIDRRPRGLLDRILPSRRRRKGYKEMMDVVRSKAVVPSDALVRDVVTLGTEEIDAAIEQLQSVLNSPQQMEALRKYSRYMDYVNFVVEDIGSRLGSSIPDDPSQFLTLLASLLHTSAKGYSRGVVHRLPEDVKRGLIRQNLLNLIYNFRNAPMIDAIEAIYLTRQINRLVKASGSDIASLLGVSLGQREREILATHAIGFSEPFLANAMIPLGSSPFSGLFPAHLSDIEALAQKYAESPELRSLHSFIVRNFTKENLSQAAELMLKTAMYRQFGVPAPQAKMYWTKERGYSVALESLRGRKLDSEQSLVEFISTLARKYENGRAWTWREEHSLEVLARGLVIDALTGTKSVEQGFLMVSEGGAPMWMVDLAQAASETSVQEILGESYLAKVLKTHMSDAFVRKLESVILDPTLDAIVEGISDPVLYSKYSDRLQALRSSIASAYNINTTNVPADIAEVLNSIKQAGEVIRSGKRTYAQQIQSSVESVVKQIEQIYGLSSGTKSTVAYTPIQNIPREEIESIVDSIVSRLMDPENGELFDDLLADVIADELVQQPIPLDLLFSRIFRNVPSYIARKDDANRIALGNLFRLAPIMESLKTLRRPYRGSQPTLGKHLWVDPAQPESSRQAKSVARWLAYMLYPRRALLEGYSGEQDINFLYGVGSRHEILLQILRPESTIEENLQKLGGMSISGEMVFGSTAPTNASWVDIQRTYDRMVLRLHTQTSSAGFALLEKSYIPPQVDRIVGPVYLSADAAKAAALEMLQNLNIISPGSGAAQSESATTSGRGNLPPRYTLTRRFQLLLRGPKRYVDILAESPDLKANPILQALVAQRFLAARGRQIYPMLETNMVRVRPSSDFLRLLVSTLPQPTLLPELSNKVAAGFQYAERTAEELSVQLRQLMTRVKMTVSAGGRVHFLGRDADALFALATELMPQAFAAGAIEYLPGLSREFVQRLDTNQLADLLQRSGVGPGDLIVDTQGAGTVLSRIHEAAALIDQEDAGRLIKTIMLQSGRQAIHSGAGRHIVISEHSSENPLRQIILRIEALYEHRSTPGAEELGSHELRVINRASRATIGRKSAEEVWALHSPSAWYHANWILRFVESAKRQLGGGWDVPVDVSATGVSDEALRSAADIVRQMDEAIEAAGSFDVINEGWFRKHVGTGELSDALKTVIEWLGLPYRKRSRMHLSSTSRFAQRLFWGKLLKQAVTSLLSAVGVWWVLRDPLKGKSRYETAWSVLKKNKNTAPLAVLIDMADKWKPRRFQSPISKQSRERLEKQVLRQRTDRDKANHPSKRKVHVQKLLQEWKMRSLDKIARIDRPDVGVADDLLQAASTRDPDILHARVKEQTGNETQKVAVPEPSPISARASVTVRHKPRSRVRREKAMMQSYQATMGAIA